jgi:hypothetical protein
LILANVIGLDFVGDRLHVAQVDGSSGAATVRGAFSAPLPQTLAPQNAAALGQWIRELLTLNKIGGSEAAVSLGRGHSSFRTIQVPDCPPEELPGLVQLTLEGDAGIEGEIVVDFDAGQPVQGQRTVTAAYASVKTVEAVREALKAAGLNTRRLVLRPYAMRFLREQMLGAGDGGTELLLIPTGDGLDLSIWSGKRLEMSRSVAVSGHDDPNSKLSAELRRTLAAYQNNNPGAILNSVAALAGDADSYGPSVQNALQRTVSSADPAKKLRNLPESKAAWGAVATAWQAAASSPPTLNLFDPRKPPPPKYNKRRIASLAGAALAILVGTVYFWRDSKIRELDAQIQEISTEAQGLAKTITANKPIEAKSAEVKKWVQSRVDWLDQLTEFAGMTPPTDQAIVTTLHGDAGARDLEAKLKVDLRAQGADPVHASMIAIQSAPRYSSVQTKGLKENPDEVEFKHNETLEVMFLPKGVKVETAAKGAKRKTVVSKKTTTVKEEKAPVIPDTVAAGKVRMPTGFGKKKAMAPAASTARPTMAAGGGPARPVTTAAVSAGESTGQSEQEAEINRLLAMPLDEFERELSKKPSLLRNRWRKSVDEARAKKAK